MSVQTFAAMPPAQTELTLDRRHIENLLGLLDAYESNFLASGAAASDVWRVFFVDADLLSVSINGYTKDSLSDWSSLLGLADSIDKKHQAASAEAEALANVVGQAVVRFVFGAFRKSADIQRQRLLVTPEHDREFKAIIYSLMRRAASPSADWLDRLKTKYLALGQHQSQLADLREAAREIFKLLVDHAHIDAEHRAYGLQQDAITTLSSHLFVPPQDLAMPGGNSHPFLFSAREPEYLQLVEERKRLIWRAFAWTLHDGPRLPSEIVALKKMVFDAHDGDKGALRPITYFRRRVHEWLRSDDAPRSLTDRNDLELQVKIAAREASDLTALAKIDALGHWLMRHQAPKGGQYWEPVLISGSLKLNRVLARWATDADGPLVRQIHPLAMLRHVEFWDPAGSKRLANAKYLDQPHEYALSLIFKRDAPQPASSPDDVEPFVASLRQQLELVTAREAEFGDRGLKGLRKLLDEGDDGFERDKYQEAVRDLLTQRFVQTYLHLTELFPASTYQLPASSLPTLDLLHSKSAMSFMTHVRNEMLESSGNVVQLQSSDLEASVREDRTGYSALLSAAIAYLARGSAWLTAAQTMSATAILLAKGRSEPHYPEGNEALYLDAFMLRMALRSPDELESFQELHRRMMREAKQTLEHWASDETDSASHRLCGPGIGPTRHAWIAYRYRVEECARDLYCLLIPVLHSRWDQLSREQLAEVRARALEVHAQGVGLIGEQREWPSEYEPSVWFCGIQSGMLLMQAWLCGRQMDRHGEFDIGPEASRFERQLEPIVAGWRSHTQKMGKLLPLLAAFYAKATGLAPEWRTHRVELTDFDVSFAGIDSARFALLRDLWFERVPRK